MQYITGDLFKHVETSKTKIAKRVYNCINYDVLQVVLDRGTFWIEKVYSEAKIPNYVHDYVVKFYSRKYKHLYA